MAKPKLVAATSDAKPERSKRARQMEMTAMALQASYEIETLAKLLYKRDQEDELVYLSRAIGTRIKTLNGIIMSAIGEGDDIAEEDVRTYERMLYG